MNNENEKIIGLLSKINAAQNEMIAAISHRSGHTAEDTPLSEIMPCIVSTITAVRLKL